MNKPQVIRECFYDTQSDLMERLFAELSPAAQRKFLDLVLSDQFPVSSRKVFETVSPGEVFLPNWHIDAMTYAAEDVMDGTIKRLITTVPPRHLKSIVFSVALPAFLLGRDPTKRIICVSYSNDSPVKHANDFRAVMTAVVSARLPQNEGQPGEGYPIRDHDDCPWLPLRHLGAWNPYRARRRPHRTG